MREAITGSCILPDWCLRRRLGGLLVAERGGRLYLPPMPRTRNPGLSGEHDEGMIYRWGAHRVKMALIVVVLIFEVLLVVHVIREGLTGKVVDGTGYNLQNGVRCYGFKNEGKPTFSLRSSPSW